MILPEVFSELGLTSKKELFAKVVHGFQLGSECSCKTP